MTGRRFILQVSGRQESGDLAGIDCTDQRVLATTILNVSVRDQAALQGLLSRIHDLGLHLVDLHELGDASSPSSGAQEFAVTVDGPVGALVEDTLSDFAGPLRISSRYSFADTTTMGIVLTRLLDRGAELEHAAEQPSAPLERI